MRCEVQWQLLGLQKHGARSDSVTAHMLDDGRAEVTPFQTMQHLSFLVRFRVAGQGRSNPPVLSGKATILGSSQKAGQLEPWSSPQRLQSRCCPFLVLWHHPVAAGRGSSLLCHHHVSSCSPARQGPGDRAGPPSTGGGSARSSREQVSRSRLSPADWRAAQGGRRGARGQDSRPTRASCAPLLPINRDFVWPVQKSEQGGPNVVQQDTTQKTLSLFPASFFIALTDEGLEFHCHCKEKKPQKVFPVFAPLLPRVKSFYIFFRKKQFDSDTGTTLITSALPYKLRLCLSPILVIQ